MLIRKNQHLRASAPPRCNFDSAIFWPHRKDTWHDLAILWILLLKYREHVTGCSTSFASVIQHLSILPSLAPSRNWLSIFFTAEQSCPDNGGTLQLLLPAGFLFQPRCLTRPLPEYHYVPWRSASSSSG